MGVFIILLSALIPVALWATTNPVIDQNNILYTVGKLSGLIGASLFAFNIILSARIKTIEKIFRGLNRVYINHHLLGALAFILLLIHPLSIALWYLPLSVQLASNLFLLSPDNVPIDFGVLALLTMIILLFITFFLPVAYEKWKITHKFLGIPLFLASFHIYLIPSDVSTNMPLRVFMLSLFGLSKNKFEAN